MTRFSHPKHIQALLPSLVQRLKVREFPRPDGKGVDRHFSMDYMGAAEFEWGALPSTLRELRGMKLPAPVEIKATRDSVPVTAWYVGPESHLEAATYWFARCVGTKDGQYDFTMKEMPQIYGAYGPDKTPGYKTITGRKVKPSQNYDRDYVGWWCVDAGEKGDGCWAILRDKTHADNWLKGITEK